MVLNREVEESKGFSSASLHTGTGTEAQDEFEERRKMAENIAKRYFVFPSVLLTHDTFPRLKFWEGAQQKLKHFGERDLEIEKWVRVLCPFSRKPLFFIFS